MQSHRVRHRVLIFVSASLLLPVAIALAGRPRSADDDKRDLLKLEDRWLAAENDPEVVKTILADDFIHALPIGFVTREEQISYLRRMKNVEEGAKHFEDMHVRVYGDVGIVNGIVVAQAGNDVQKTVFTDVFVRRNGEWQAVNAQEVPFRQRTTP